MILFIPSSVSSSLCFKGLGITEVSKQYNGIPAFDKQVRAVRILSNMVSVNMLDILVFRFYTI